MNKQEIWKKILNIAITILTAIATTFGVTSCMGVLSKQKKRVTFVPLFLFGILVYIMMNVGAERWSPKMKNAPQVCCLSTRLRGLLSLFLELSLKK